MKQVFLFFFLLVQLPAFSQPDLQKLFSKLRESKQDSDKVLAYRKLSQYYSAAKFDSAVYFAETGLRLARKIKYRKGELLLISQLAFVNQSHGNLEKAKKYGLEALEGFKETNNFKELAAVNNGLGIIEGKKGNLDVATVYFINALRLYEKIKYPPGIVQSYIKLGVVNERSSNLDKALLYYQRARKMNGGKYYDLYSDVNLINNIGIIYARKGDLTQALSLFKEGIKKSDSPECAVVHVNLLTNTGNVYQNLGKLRTARIFHRLSIENARKHGLPEEEARALLNLSMVLEKEDSMKSVEYLKRALTIAQGMGQKRLLSEIYEALTERYQQQGDYKAALLALKEQHKLIDTLFTLDKEREISSLQEGYELDKSKQHIQTLELLNQKRTIQRNAGVIAAVLVSCLLVSLGAYLYRVRKLNKELKASNLVKDKLFSIIGHDLRSPMGTAVQMLDLIEQNEVDAPESKHLLTILKKHAEASFDTLNTLLQWGKAQLQGVKVNKTIFSPGPIIDKNLDILAAASAEKSIKIAKSIPPELEIYADPDHFNFVIRNLLSNAVKFTYPHGSIEISVAGGKKPGFVTFSVKDNGKGIGEEQKDLLFESFTATGHGTAGEKGTGIGLILCKEFVLANEGEIWAGGSEGKGAEFFFTLRIVTGDDRPDIRSKKPVENLVVS